MPINLRRSSRLAPATVLVCALVSLSVLADEALDEREQIEFFESRIRPVLVEHCYSCHSADAKGLKANLRVDSRDGLVQGGDSGPAVVPGDLDASLLLSALRYDDYEMPPAGRLPDRVIRDFERWIRTGAIDPRDAPSAGGTNQSQGISWEQAKDFWSFQPPRRQPSQSSQHPWARGPIDGYILDKLNEHGLQPSAEAAPHQLIRRAYFDLIGLPPTPQQVAEFVQSDDPDAYPKLVDQLLESPHYGERWGRHWLDVARYAEDQAHTFKARNYPRAFLYRDWVIDALNRDMPYDEFLKCQIAGDLLSDENIHQRVPALGLFALGPVYYAENVEKDKAEADKWDDRIDTLTRGVLGLTVSCARCHDHKYDPISTEDYYALAGIFASTKYQERPAVSAEVVEQRQLADRKVEAQQQAVDQLLRDGARHWRTTPAALELVPQYWKSVVAIQRAEQANRNKAIKELAKQEKLDESTLKKWAAFFIDRKAVLEEEQEIYQRWFDFLADVAPDDVAPVDDDKTGKKEKLAEKHAKQVEALGAELVQLVRPKLDSREELFTRFGSNAAFVRDSDRAQVRPGVIPLGNLFDDSANVDLNVALTSDRFKAVASPDSLGVDRILFGWGDHAEIAEGIQFEFGRIGGNERAFGSIVNDAWETSGGGIRTTGQATRSNLPRTEQGIGMHANALITFDLAELRRAGQLPADQAFRFVVDRAGINDEAFGSAASAYLAVIVSRPHREKGVTDAILSAHINGQPFENIGTNDFRYYFAGPLPPPLEADGQFVSMNIEVPSEARYLTLVACGSDSPADNTISSDHTVFSGARLEQNPLPDAKVFGPAVEREGSELEKRDAIILSRFLFDDGLLAIPDSQVEPHLPETARARLAELRAVKEALQKEAAKIEVVMAHSLVESSGTDQPVYLRGDPAKKGDVVPRSMPTLFTAGERQPFLPTGSGRLELAHAIAAPDNPLTARVIVNRIWAGHFGKGLVGTTSNFGQLGNRPSHPELLDHLALRLIESGWSLKTIHREIMLSSAYRQESGDNSMDVDPENRWLSRMSRRRLEIEPWRDALLSVTGELDLSVGGKSARLTDAGNRRRTVYAVVSRHRLDELLRLFDFPDPNITAAARSMTTVPQQQLFVLNSPFMADRAKALANRVQTERASDPERIDFAYRLLFARPPRPQELTLALEFLQAEDSSETEDKLSRWEQYCLALLASNEFLFID